MKHQSDPNLLIGRRRKDTAINLLKTGLGQDDIHSNHIKYSGKGFRNLLRRFFTMCLTNNFLPVSMLLGEKKPRPKNNISSKTCSDICMPVMRSSNLFKVFEYLVLQYLEGSLKLYSSQFGSRKYTSCLSAVTVLKETIVAYRKQQSKVHCAMLYLSKTFGKINIGVLVKKLLHTDLRRALVNIVEYILINTYAYVNYNDVNGNKWRIGKGIRLGELFLLYFLFSV